MLEKQDLKLIAGIVEKSIEPMREDVRNLQKDVHGLKEDVGGLQQDVHGLKEDIHNLQNDVHDQQEEMILMRNGFKEIKVTLENEVRRSIKIIGEGHRDLSRKLNEAQKVTSEQEMLQLRVTWLESEIRKTKEPGGEPA